MEIQSFPLGALGANCYLVQSSQNNVAAIDIGGSPDRLWRIMQSQGLQLRMILLTHGHYDHIGGVARLQELSGAPVYVHEQDAAMLCDEKSCLARFCGCTEFAPVTGAKTLTDGSTLTLDELTFTVLHTPGHTAGSVCYRCNDVLFSGDTLFRMSVGRTNFPSGSSRDIRRSLKMLGALDGDLRVLPGHGEETSLAFERASNPYVAQE